MRKSREKEKKKHKNARQGVKNRRKRLKKVLTFEVVRGIIIKHSRERVAKEP